MAYRIQIGCVPFLLLLAAAIAAFWFFGRSRPVVVGDPSQPHARAAACATCKGAGKVACPRCGGHGGAMAEETCWTCHGQGKDPLRFSDQTGFRCPACQGKGTVKSRKTCVDCIGSGKILCPGCKGLGKTWSSFAAPSLSVAIGYSWWERSRLLLQLPVEANPCPQRSPSGGYPMVERYLELLSAPRAARVKEWGEFRLQGSAWKMTANVEFQTPSGTRLENMEFAVQDRKLIRSGTTE